MLPRPALLASELNDHGLLAQLARSDRHRIAKKMELVSLASNEMIFDTSGAIEDVFFPLSAVLSLSGTTTDGDVVEINLIGCEGIAGVEVACRTHFCCQPLVTTIVQMAGTALRMSAEHFAEEVDQHPAVNRCVYRYMGYFLSQLQLFGACNRHHSLEQRCARRLLTAQDMSDGAQTLRMTQHQLAQLLGVSRQSIDRVLQVLEERNILQLSRGRMRIHDRKELKLVSCLCYRILRRERHGLLASA